MNPKLLKLIELVLQVDWKHDHIATIHVCSSKGVTLQLLKLGITDHDRFFESVERDEVALDKAIWTVESILNGTYATGGNAHANGSIMLGGRVATTS